MADMWVIVSVSLMQQTPVSVTWGHSCRGQDTQPASGAQHVGSCGGKQSRGLPQEGTLGCAWGSGRKRSPGVGDRAELGFTALGWLGWPGLWEPHPAAMPGGGCWVSANGNKRLPCALEEVGTGDDCERKANSPGQDLCRR